MDFPTGKVQTVCGPISPGQLGFTMTHEHLNHQANSEKFHPRKPDEKYAAIAKNDFKLNERWWIDFHPYSHEDNLRFQDKIVKKAVQEEMNFYYANGGRTICELTSFGRDLQYFRHLQLETKVNIVAGSGYYVASGLPQSTLSLKVEQIYDNIVQEFSGEIRSGLLGELGTSFPMHDFERRVLQAAGQLSELLPTLPVNVHPGRGSEIPGEALRIFQEAGGRKEKLVMSHLDRGNLPTNESLLEFAKLGCILEFDLFGIETTYYELSDATDMPGDAQRIKWLRCLIEEGYLDNLVIAQDIHTKHRLMAYGGHGYSHILMNTIPTLRRKGFTEKEIQQITVETPKRWLTL